MWYDVLLELEDGDQFVLRCREESEDGARNWATLYYTHCKILTVNKG